jgi:poly [ADP-ribose] polymerase
MLYLELRFLQSLWPQGEIDTMLIDAYSHGCLQMIAYRSLAQPLYQAYSSLRHGFRRLSNLNSTEYRELKMYLERSCHPSHSVQIKLQEIYSVFVKTGAPNPYRDWIDSNPGRDINKQDRLLLWHGTSLDSVMGILDVGLQIRRNGARFTGTMYGNAIYLADTSSKSAGFCKHGNFKDTDSVLLLCEADAGENRIRNYMSNANGHQDSRSKGARCIQGMGRSSPGGWKKAGWEMPGEPRKGTVWLVSAGPLGTRFSLSEMIMTDEETFVSPTYPVITFQPSRRQA